MDLSLDVGVGLLEFFHLDLTYLHGRTWSIGLGVGFFPVEEVLCQAMGVENLNASIDVQELRLEGGVDTSLVSGRIFGRWYPWDGWFYLEGAFALWTLKAGATGILSYHELPGDISLDVAARVWVPMLGAHVGWRFLFEIGAYIDLGLGINFLFAPKANLSFDDTVERYGYDPEAAVVIRNAQAYLGDELAEGVNRVSADIPAFPTAFVRFGWALDLW